MSTADQRKWKTRKLLAWVWLTLWFVSLGVLSHHVFRSSCPVPSADGWRSVDASMAAAMAGLLLFAGLMHTADSKWESRGFADVHKAVEAEFQLDDGVVSGILTVQSIRVAIVIGILIALLGQPPPALPSERVSDIIGSPLNAIYAAIVVALGTSVVSTLVSLLCFDYSLRFSWAHAEVKKNLRVKAHRLQVYGFYALMWSLAVMPSMFNYYVGIGALAIVFWAAWYYYFFPRNILEKRKSVTPTTTGGFVEAASSEARVALKTSPVTAPVGLEAVLGVAPGETVEFAKLWALSRSTLEHLQRGVPVWAKWIFDTVIAIGDEVSKP